jgi:hypothetical protein
MERNRHAFQERLANATPGLADLSTGKAEVQVLDKAGKSSPAPELADAQSGPSVAAPVPAGGAVVIDLHGAREVRALAFSRDRSAVRCDGVATACALEGSVDGTAWIPLVERLNKPAAAVG